MANNSFVLLSRSILESQVFANDKMLKIWIWCLCKANHKNRFVPLRIGKGVTTVEVKRGQFIFGRGKAEEELFYDGSTIYKIMQKFEAMEMVKIESNNQYSIITICNYDDYQDAGNYEVTTNEQPTPIQVTGNGQQGDSTVAPNGQQGNTNKNVNNVKNVKNVKNSLSTQAEPKGPEAAGVSEVVSKKDKYQRFLDLFNDISKREYKTMGDKARGQLDKLLKKNFTAENFRTAITNGAKDAQDWTKPSLFSPEYITREAEFERYLYMQPTDAKAVQTIRGNFNLAEIAKNQATKVYR